MDKNKIIEEVMLDTDWKVLWAVHKAYLKANHCIEFSYPDRELERFKELGRDLLEDLIDMPYALEVGTENLVAHRSGNIGLFTGYGLMYRVSGGNSWTEKK